MYIKVFWERDEIFVRKMQCTCLWCMLKQSIFEEMKQSWTIQNPLRPLTLACSYFYSGLKKLRKCLLFLISCAIVFRYLVFSDVQYDKFAILKDSLANRNLQHTVFSEKILGFKRFEIKSFLAFSAQNNFMSLSLSKHRPPRKSTQRAYVEL